jgi:hypothetical protein
MSDQFYLHMTPSWWSSDLVNDMPVFDYDPCLFHLLFQPSPKLQKDNNRQYKRIATSSSSSTIGIHFCTGDAIAIHHSSGGDVRVTTDLSEALDKLVECARDMAKGQGLSHTHFYLATDNRKVQ